ncbi:hypothetical protein BDV30DRAFT_203740 [Aspergillus minisclerotigenes]|uniref:Uncharacterized protein n=1 Tax=Aspergillus minisclerotigenes TaxID=656917 RepID=A0A5N6JKP8_9EURO|nr:hypothetical protein BDV30DRAFT_203740 [Aspergillus minisclerotigenes]
MTMFHMGSMLRLLSLLAAIIKFVAATASILALLKAIIRLNDAYKRQKEQSTFPRRYQDELRDIKSVTQIIEEEEALQTAAIKAQLRTIVTLSQSLEDGLFLFTHDNLEAFVGEDFLPSTFAF